MNNKQETNQRIFPLRAKITPTNRRSLTENTSLKSLAPQKGNGKDLVSPRTPSTLQKLPSLSSHRTLVKQQQAQSLSSSFSTYLKDREKYSQPKTVIGDIHGNLNGLTEILSQAKIIDKNGDWIPTVKKQVIQVGDVIDRGKNPAAAWRLLSKLQKQAKSYPGKGSVIRLIGNHELMLLKRAESYKDFSKGSDITDREAFRQEVSQDIIDDKVKYAHWDGKRLYVHGGLNYTFQKIAEQELRQRCNIKKSAITGEHIATYLNCVLKTAVKIDDWSHQALLVAISTSTVFASSPLWERYDKLVDEYDERQLPQIVGHTIPDARKPYSKAISITRGSKLACVDCLILKETLAYLELRKGFLIVTEKADDVWKKTSFRDKLVKKL